MELVTFQRKKMSGRDKATNQLKDYQKKRGPGVRTVCCTGCTSSTEQIKQRREGPWEGKEQALIFSIGTLLSGAFTFVPGGMIRKMCSDFFFSEILPFLIV